MAYSQFYFILSAIPHNLRQLDGGEISKRLLSFAQHFQKDARGFADELLKIINRDEIKTMPTLDYVIIVGQSLIKPNHVIVIVYNEKHGNCNTETVARIEHWIPNEFVGVRAQGFEVFVIE